MLAAPLAPSVARRCLGTLLVLLLNVSHELGGTGATGLWDAVFASFVAFTLEEVIQSLGQNFSLSSGRLSETEHRALYFLKFAFSALQLW